MIAQRKPYDLGNGLPCASFAAEGSWLSVSAPHPGVGVVELSAVPAFPAERDGQVDLVRAHRAHLTDPATAILRVTGALQDNDPDPGGAPGGLCVATVGTPRSTHRPRTWSRPSCSDTS